MTLAPTRSRPSTSPRTPPGSLRRRCSDKRSTRACDPYRGRSDCTVVGGENQLVLSAKARLKRRKQRIELLQGVAVSADVAAMTVLRIEIVEIRENEKVIDPIQQLERSLHSVAVVGNPHRRRYASPAIDIANLSYRMHLDKPAPQFVEQVRGRLDCMRHVDWRPPKRPRFSQKRPGDDPVHVMRRLERLLRGPVRTNRRGSPRHDLLVSGDLEDRIRRCIKDRAPAQEVRRTLSSSMISVPDGRFISRAAPCRRLRANSSTTSGGKPLG